MGKKANVSQENRAKACVYKKIGWLDRKIEGKNENIDKQCLQSSETERINWRSGGSISQSTSKEDI